MEIFSFYFFLLDFKDDICYAGLAAFPQKSKEEKKEEKFVTRHLNLIPLILLLRFCYVLAVTVKKDVQNVCVYVC